MLWIYDESVDKRKRKFKKFKKQWNIVLLMKMEKDDINVKKKYAKEMIDNFKNNSSKTRRRYNWRNRK